MMLIRPYDILFFRESRDFSAGENHVAESIEPLPHTIVGAIMGTIYEEGRLDLLNLERAGRDVKKIPNSENWRPNFSILGTFFGLVIQDKGDKRGKTSIKPLFAIPMDVVEVEDEIAPLGRHLLPDGRIGVVAEVGERKVLHFEPKKGFITAGILERYLSGDLKECTFPEDSILEVREVYERETRIGIGLNGNKTAEEGLLYRISTLRFRRDRDEDLLKETAIFAYFETEGEESVKNAIGQEGLLKLGGESRFADFEFKDGGFPLKAGGEVKAGQTFRLYVATPLIVKGNSVSAFIEGELNGKARVVRVFTDRLVRVTGWDAVEKMPKPTYYALQPGTVIWMKALEDLRIPAKLGRMTWAGYGLVLVGSGW